MVEGPFQESEGFDGVEEAERSEGGHSAGFAVRANKHGELHYVRQGVSPLLILHGLQEMIGTLNDIDAVLLAEPWRLPPL